MTVDPEYSDTIIIGAGPAGLATAACLRRAGQAFILLERADTVASSWRSRYKRLHLHTNNGLSSLPFRRFPASYPRYPSLQQVVDYLDSYAAALDLHPRFGEDVQRVYAEGANWHTLTDQHRYVSRSVVVASGAYARPTIPAWLGQESYRGEIVHSSRYVDGAPYAGKNVLVVGFGNSGGEIVIDLLEHGAQPTIAVRGPVNIIPRDVLGIPIMALALVLDVLPVRIADALSAPIIRAALGELRALGLKRPLSGPFTQIRREKRIPVIDVGTVRLIRQGKIALRPGIERFTASGVVFAGGQEGAYAAVILATGFEPAADFVEGLSADSNEGIERASGLYFCGFSTPATGLLREIGHEAQAIARQITRNQVPR